MITSLHSPHVEAVKALLGPRGVKERREQGRYIAEGLQNVTAALERIPDDIECIYYTEDGIARLGSFYHSNLIEVSPQVMKAMTDTVSPQGVLAVIKIKDSKLADLEKLKEGKFLYFWEIQDPGNAGTIIRTADAFGFDAVIFSENSVDVFSPKVVRSTAGSFANLKLVEGVSIAELVNFAERMSAQIYLTVAGGELSLNKAVLDSKDSPSIWVFGNEARGIPQEVQAALAAKRVFIPMSGRTESLNLASAASVVMYVLSNTGK